MLLAASEMLQQDLHLLAAQWSSTTGSYGMRLVDGASKDGLRRILFGLVTMSAQELAGERMQTALYTNAQEEEQDCFSDDTHRSLHANAAGIELFYRGSAQTSLAALLAQRDAALSAAIDQAFARTRQAMQDLHTAGERGETFDRLVQPGHPQADLIAQAIAGLEAQARLLEQAGAALELGALNPQGAP